MTQGNYRLCMAEKMGSGRLRGLSKEDRRIEFCAIAKVCSKDIPYNEAKQICISQPPKEPKPRRSRSGKCADPAELAACISTNINIEELTVDNLPARLETAITHCSMTKSASPPTYKRFMNACLKETGAGGDFIKAQGDIKKCQEKWNEKRGVQ